MLVGQQSNKSFSAQRRNIARLPGTLAKQTRPGFETTMGYVHFFPLTLRTLRLTRMDTNYRESISPVERLAFCLRFLTTGDSYRTIGFSFRVGRSTVAGIVPSVAQAIWDCLVGENMPVPKEEDWRAIAAEFLEVEFPQLSWLH
ncbi:unnamed protein product [Oncorhynchus mykiss]|uniref:Transposase Helix-turn-helix domain-containing protein n=1 Tax=Oncorhynchus mykiss TaxID=8022 RepID=A0A060WQ81_ONCMY|nr:unnamed protein product [Oncorhynchus mykiss]